MLPLSVVDLVEVVDLLGEEVLEEEVGVVALSAVVPEEAVEEEEEFGTLIVKVD